MPNLTHPDWYSRKYFTDVGGGKMASVLEAGPSLVNVREVCRWLKQAGQVTCECYNSYLELTSAERAVCMHAQLLWLCTTLCDSVDCSPPGSSVHGILQARILEWVAMPSSRGSSRPGDQTWFLQLLNCRQILYHWAIKEPPVKRGEWKELTLGSTNFWYCCVFQPPLPLLEVSDSVTFAC